MFTGIVQTRLTVENIEQANDFSSLFFRFNDELLTGLETGASVAVNGVCLTVRNIDGARIQFDVIGQTLRLTNLSALQLGDDVNIERAARYGDEIGGHMVSGHITQTVKVLSVEDSENNRVVWMQRPEEIQAYLLDKGFVALNGCSLTIAEVQQGRFCVHLIPETRDVTTFGQVQEGDDINLEIDAQTQAIVDTVNKVLSERF